MAPTVTHTRIAGSYRHNANSTGDTWQMPASIANRPSSSWPRRAVAVGGLCLCGLTAQVPGCGRGATEPLRGACTSELRVASSPGDTTVSVGASFTASVKLASSVAQMRAAGCRRDMPARQDREYAVHQRISSRPATQGGDKPAHHASQHSASNDVGRIMDANEYPCESDYDA